jgi:4,5-DOPA dioxygenase extradiol
MRMPALFVGHGNPMNAIERNAFHRSWEALGARLPRPKAVLCVSAHWETRNTYVTATETPETIHDFYGFPKALFDVRYPAPGAPALAGRVASLVATERLRLDPGRGLDHGAWSVLVAMYPEADVPVVQLSIDTSQPGRHHYPLARQLAPLRDEGVLVMGSGNIVHNLRQFDFRDPTPLAWAERSDAEIRGHIEAGRHEALMDYPGSGADARLAVPTPEHYLPLLYPIALQQRGEAVEFFNGTVQGSISMTSVLIGAGPEGKMASRGVLT